MLSFQARAVREVIFEDKEFERLVRLAMPGNGDALIAPVPKGLFQSAPPRIDGSSIDAFRACLEKRLQILKEMARDPAGLPTLSREEMERREAARQGVAEHDRGFQAFVDGDREVESARKQLQEASEAQRLASIRVDEVRGILRPDSIKVFKDHPSVRSAVERCSAIENRMRDIEQRFDQAMMEEPRIFGKAQWRERVAAIEGERSSTKQELDAANATVVEAAGSAQEDRLRTLEGELAKAVQQVDLAKAAVDRSEANAKARWQKVVSNCPALRAEIVELDGKEKQELDRRVAAAAAIQDTVVKAEAALSLLMGAVVHVGMLGLIEASEPMEAGRVLELAEDVVRTRVLDLLGSPSLQPLVARWIETAPAGVVAVLNGLNVAWVSLVNNRKRTFELGGQTRPLIAWVTNPLAGLLKERGLVRRIGPDEAFFHTSAGLLVLRAFVENDPGLVRAALTMLRAGEHWLAKEGKEQAAKSLSGHHDMLIKELGFAFNNDSMMIGIAVFDAKRRALAFREASFSPVVKEIDIAGACRRLEEDGFDARSSGRTIEVYARRRGGSPVQVYTIEGDGQQWGAFIERAELVYHDGQPPDDDNHGFPTLELACSFVRLRLEMSADRGLVERLRSPRVPA